MSATVVYTASMALFPEGPSRPAFVEVDAAGRIVRTGRTPPSDGAAPVEDLGRTLLLPGFVNAHSHAFQRRLRGIAQSRSAGDPSSFWSWRRAMYELAGAMDPDAFEAATRLAYREMVRAGITTVGEFHYVHHGPDGRPYGDPNEMSLRVAAAAEAVGLRVVLLEVYYARAGAGEPPAGTQRRFCDGSAEAYLHRVEALRAAGHRVGLAPHSVRAVPAEDLSAIAEHARRADLPLHIHVSEQPAENAACRAEHGVSPVGLLARTGVLREGTNTTCVHATFLEAGDVERLSGHRVCLCPTTEADLGDGLPPAGPMFEAGVRFCLGSDSNAVVDLVQEARLAEMGERLRTGRRICLEGRGRTPAENLLDAATQEGARALGLGGEVGALAAGAYFDAAAVDLDHPLFAEVPPHRVLDTLLLSGTAACVRATFVGGRRVFP